VLTSASQNDHASTTNIEFTEELMNGVTNALFNPPALILNQCVFLLLSWKCHSDLFKNTVHKTTREKQSMHDGLPQCDHLFARAQENSVELAFGQCQKRHST